VSREAGHDDLIALKRIFFEGEVFVSAQVVDPELQMPVRLRTPRLLGCWFAVEKENVGFDALRVDLNLLGAKNETGRPRG